MNLVVFDIDGVILDVDLGGFKYLAQAIGKQDEVEELHKEYQRRRKKGPWGLEQLTALFEGESYERLNKIAKDFCDSHLMPGTKETIEKLKAKGFKVALMSGNPLIITKQLKEILGADFITGNEMEVENGIFTGKLKRKVDRFTKAEDLMKIIEENAFEKIYIIGDSVTDLPMAEHGILISFNCYDLELNKKAEFIVKEKDLTKILEFIK